MKLGQIDKISAHTCIFDDTEICVLDKISTATVNMHDYINNLCALKSNCV